MPPELSIAVFPFDRSARKPLFLGNALEMPIAVSVQTMIGHKDGFHDDPALANRHDRQIAHIEINRHSHQVGVLLALYDLAGFDPPDLGDMQLCRMGSQDQGRASTL